MSDVTAEGRSKTTIRWFVLLARRVRRDEGVVAVEAALVTPLLFLVVFGIIEFGMYYKDAITVTGMARSAARTASAEPRQASQLTDTVAAITSAVASASAGSVEELWIYDAGSNGFPVGKTNFTAGCTNCVKYTWNGAAFAAVTGFTWNVLLQNACPSDAAHGSVGVYIKANHRFITGLFPGSLSASDHAVMRLEPIPSSAGCK